MATKSVKSTPAVLVQLTALEPVRLDGVDYAPGDVFEALEADAQALVSLAAAELLPVAA